MILDQHCWPLQYTGNFSVRIAPFRHQNWLYSVSSYNFSCSFNKKFSFQTRNSLDKNSRFLIAVLFSRTPWYGDAQSFWESNSAVSISSPRSSDKDCVNLVRVMIYLENYPNRSGLSCDWLIADTERRLSICIQLIWLFSWFLNLVQALD